VSAQTSTNNTALFQTGPQRKPEASRSWWMEADTREAFQAAAEREQRRMARSVGAAMVPGGIIVGHIKAKG
jgi:hypothetical protein